MRHLFLFLVIALVIAGCACDSTWSISGALNTSSFSGTVSVVHLTVSGSTQITIVTLLDTRGANDFTFCGDVVSQFPMNSRVQGSYQPGTPCGTIVKITVTG